MINTCACESE